MGRYGRRVSRSLIGVLIITLVLGLAFYLKDIGSTRASEAKANLRRRGFELDVSATQRRRVAGLDADRQQARHAHNQAKPARRFIASNAARKRGALGQRDLVAEHQARGRERRSLEDAAGGMRKPRKTPAICWARDESSTPPCFRAGSAPRNLNQRKSPSPTSIRPSSSRQSDSLTTNLAEPTPSSPAIV